MEFLKKAVIYSECLRDRLGDRYDLVGVQFTSHPPTAMYKGKRGEKLSHYDSSATKFNLAVGDQLSEAA